MDLRFSLVAILLLFSVTSHCFLNENGSVQMEYISNEKSDHLPVMGGSQKTISELKCEQYIEEIAKINETVIVPVDDIYESAEPIKLTNYCKCKTLKHGCGCGGASPSAINQSDDGTEAYLGEYPHMVALGKYNSDGIFIFKCGGSLISHTWVLSAVYCTYGKKGTPTHARMGITKLTDQRNGITIPIKNIVRHPDYEPSRVYADIALIELETSITFSLTIYPACLYPQYDLPLHKQATITGWGAAESDGEQGDYLQKVPLPVIDNVKCIIIKKYLDWQFQHGISSNLVCAGSEVGTDACYGQYGDPLEIQGTFCKHHIIGITIGNEYYYCGITNTSRVYTRVSHYVPWIEHIVWPQESTYSSTPNISTPDTTAYNVTTSTIHNTTTNISTLSKFDKYLKEHYSHPPSSLLDLTTLTNGSRRTISELKCGEYADEIADSTKRLKFGEKIYVWPACRLYKYNGHPAIGGKLAELGDYPHMVALGKYNSDGIFILICGGTLISHTWVLSAAHCTHAPNGAPSDARMGINKLTGQRYGITRSIKNMVRHPDYNPPALYADIALMELALPVTEFSVVLHPACLYQQFDLPLNRSHATVTGWGATEIDGDQSDYLQQVTLPVIDNLKCKVQHNTSKEIPHGITSSMICAGGKVGQDACSGDSGGPLQIQQNLCVHHIIGITSFGRSCGFANTFGVYTRVSHYVPWIEGIVWPQQN